MSDIDIRITGRAGRITLTRPQALNAMTYEMCLAIEAAMDSWREDAAVALVVIDASRAGVEDMGMPWITANSAGMRPISAIIGASWAGSRSMTATSGPGFSLMMEGIGYACMSEAPCVIVNVQRSGPSTGQPTEPAQGDMMQVFPEGHHAIDGQVVLELVEIHQVQVAAGTVSSPVGVLRRREILEVVTHLVQHTVDDVAMAALERVHCLVVKVVARRTGLAAC